MKLFCKRKNKCPACSAFFSFEQPQNACSQQQETVVATSLPSFSGGTGGMESAKHGATATSPNFAIRVLEPWSSLSRCWRIPHLASRTCRASCTISPPPPPQSTPAGPGGGECVNSDRSTVVVGGGRTLCDRFALTFFGGGG